jgi:AcrR family transcriptional regulator
MTIRVRGRARKQPAEVRREEILDAAVRVFAHSSYHVAGTADIARQAGIAEPTIYRHFGSKRELYLAALQRCGDVIVSAFRDIAERQPDPLLALHEMGTWYGQSMTIDPEPLRMRQRAIAESEDEETRECLQVKYKRIVAIVSAVIARGQEQGAFSTAISAEGLAWGFCAMGQMMDAAMLMDWDTDLCSTRFDEMNLMFLRALLADPDSARNIHEVMHKG